MTFTTLMKTRTLRWGAAALVLSVGLAAALETDNPPVTLIIDAAADRHPISPNIYGVAHATPDELRELNAPLHRLGGNHTSRYNWRLNAYNRGIDWFFESIGEPGAAAGAAADTFVSQSQTLGAQPMLTMPMLDWVARLDATRGRTASFSIWKYGPQKGRDGLFPDAGNGIQMSGEFVPNNDPNDANVPASPGFQQAWVEHLVSRFGKASAGGVRFYQMDNEPSLWHVTHRDVHATGASMDEVRSKIIQYSAAVRRVDPDAVIVGPEEWGWPGYLYSGYDQQWARRWGWGGSLPDRAGHGGAEYLPWLLDQLRRYGASTGRRPLDVFSVHYYPQGGEYSADVSSAMQLRRNRSTRALWDPDYVDQSWINDRVQLIPRLRRWANTFYAVGTPVAITEYSWGAEGHISGATAQADILGIFGREGLDMAVRWATPDAITPTFKAMKLYRSYDGNGSGFGDVSLRAQAPNPDEMAVFGAERSSDGALTVMVVSKRLSGSTPVTLSVANFAHAGSARRWQLTSANAITRLADVSVAGARLETALPAQSITLFVLPAARAGKAEVPVD